MIDRIAFRVYYRIREVGALKNVLGELSNEKEGIAMFWTLSFHLMEDETVIDDSTRRPISGIRPAYSVFLTNKRVIFRFDGVGSAMAQSFQYNEIVEAVPVKRLLINYLLIRTATKNYFLHTATPDIWAKKIIECKQTLAARTEMRSSTDQPARRKQDLLYMLISLQRYNVLSQQELEQKTKLLDNLSV